MNIVLLEPEIALNTGNIGRTCVATSTKLHLIEPMGFVLSEKNIKRAGMDYWERLDVKRYKDLDDFFSKNKDANNNIFYATTKALNTYNEVKYNDNSYIVFGSEGSGIPEDILVKNKNRCIRIPMTTGERSLNLSNSVAIVLYEALRQTGFKNLEKKGMLHRNNWEL